MKLSISFSSLYHLALQALDLQIQNLSHFKQNQSSDPLWDQAAPKMESYLANSLYLAAVQQTHSNLPWHSLLHQAQNSLNQIPTPDRSQLPPGLLYFHASGCLMIQRPVTALLNHFPLHSSIII